MSKKQYLVVGSGFSGAVLAERLSRQQDCMVTVLEARGHIGGNCYTERDTATGIMVHRYGPHIFNTDNKEVWDYISSFCEMTPFINRVKAVYKGGVYSMPVNLHTINQFFGTALGPEAAKLLLDGLADKSIQTPANFEEQALAFIGKELYRAFFYGYTKKQWGCEPAALPAAILKRLPVRFNYDDNYYAHRYQGIPRDGYTAIFEQMLQHPAITVQLHTKFDRQFDTAPYDHVFFTGPIDAFFDYKFGRLGYRTVYFEREEAAGDYQGNAVINYTEENVPYTRIHEHKHFAPWETYERTVYFKEYSKETAAGDIPYYPKRLKEDMERLALYQQEAASLEKYTFLGRLATYRYMDMHHVIAEAMEVAAAIKERS